MSFASRMTSRSRRIPTSVRIPVAIAILRFAKNDSDRAKVEKKGSKLYNVSRPAQSKPHYDVSFGLYLRVSHEPAYDDFRLTRLPAL
jgi:hypothetical protein